MVYLRQIIEHQRENLFQHKNIELAAYLFISDPENLKNIEFNLSPEEEVSIKGYMEEQVAIEEIDSIISKSPIKGIDATSNIYKLAGLFLASKGKYLELLKTKYTKCDLRQKYFLSKIEPSFKTQLIEDIRCTPSESMAALLKKVFEVENISELEIQESLVKVISLDIDVLTQIILEDLEKTLIKIKYENKTTEEMVRDILHNFSNAVKKVLANRRKDHPEFSIDDEYDVQDILYVILKAIFPTLKDEDPIPKVGAKSSKIDLILRQEEILIEVKMIKKSDSNEVHFIEQLKVDFESYHECQWLKKMFCFVYDPFKKTRDVSNFYDLNGDRSKSGHRFNVEVIVVN